MVENYLYFNSRGTSVPITKGEFDDEKMCDLQGPDRCTEDARGSSVLG